MTVVLGKCISAASFPGKNSSGNHRYTIPSVCSVWSPADVVEQREPTGNLKVEYSGNERLEIQCDFKLKYM